MSESDAIQAAREWAEAAHIRFDEADCIEFVAEGATKMRALLAAYDAKVEALTRIERILEPETYEGNYEAEKAWNVARSAIAQARGGEG